MESQPVYRIVASERYARMVTFALALCFFLASPIAQPKQLSAQDQSSSQPKNADEAEPTSRSTRSQAFFSPVQLVDSEGKKGLQRKAQGEVPQDVKNSTQLKLAAPLEFNAPNAHIVPQTDIFQFTENSNRLQSSNSSPKLSVQLATPIETSSPISPSTSNNKSKPAVTSVVTSVPEPKSPPQTVAEPQLSVVATIPSEKAYNSLSIQLPLLVSNPIGNSAGSTQTSSSEAKPLSSDVQTSNGDVSNQLDVMNLTDGLIASNESPAPLTNPNSNPFDHSQLIVSETRSPPHSSAVSVNSVDSVNSTDTSPLLTNAVPANAPEVALVLGDIRSSWLLFEDPALQEMIERVIRQNPGLRDAEARILQSRAMFSRATADLFPQVSANAQHAYRRFSQNGNAFVQDSTTTQGFDWYSSGFDTRWEVDLFGRLRGIRSAASFEALAAEQSYRDVMITLIGDLMLSYVEYALATERIRIAHQNLVVQQDILELTKERLRIGEDGALSVAQAQTQVELTRASLPALEEQRSVALNRLLVLQGVGAQAFDVPHYWGQRLPELPANSPTSIDCELLARRPDVRSSRLLVSAQLERLGASKAEYYPQVFINGTISLETRDMDVWWDERSLAHNVGPTISLNLLDFGRIRANIRSERAKYEQAVARYQQSVLDATEEVRNAMVGVERQRERADGLSVAAKSAHTVIEMARLEYQEGVTNFQNVLDAQRQLLTIEDQRAVAQGTALISYARLFKALGGAWYDSVDPAMPTGDTIEMPAITQLPK